MSEFAASLGVSLPFIQAPMAGVQGSALALAVSRAGGLGFLPGAMLTPEQLASELQALQDSGLPYGVNFFAHRPAEPSPALLRAWNERLAPFFAQHNLDTSTVPSAASRQPFGQAQAELLARFTPRVVSFHFGLPSAELLAAVRQTGAQIWSSATTVAEARWLVAHGADVLIAQGWEAGGHRGHFLSDDLSEQTGTFALLPQVVAAVDVPVVAAGGIATAGGVAAAMALGASAVQVGTALLCANEASTSALHRAALMSEAARHTTVTNVFTGRPARGIVNFAIRELGDGDGISALAPPFPYAGNAMGMLKGAAEKQGKADFSSLWSGQNASQCREAPAADIVAALSQGFSR